MAHHVFRRPLVSGSPYADTVATNPDLLVPLKYESTAADGQLLYEDNGATTPVEDSGDPVGATKDLDGAIQSTQSVDGRRPLWLGESVGVQGDGTSDYLDLGNPGDPAIPETGDFGLFALVKFNSKATDESIIFSQFIGAAGNGRLYLRHESDGDFLVFLGDDGTRGSVTLETTSGATDGDIMLAGLVRTGNSFSLRINGAEEDSLTEAGTRSILQTGNLIFARSNGPGGYTDSPTSFGTDGVQLIGVYEETLTSTRIDEIEGAYADLGGITL